MRRRPPRSTLDRSSAASDVYKRQQALPAEWEVSAREGEKILVMGNGEFGFQPMLLAAVSYTHLRAHETVLDLVCRLLLENKKTIINDDALHNITT